MRNAAKGISVQVMPVAPPGEKAAHLSGRGKVGAEDRALLVCVRPGRWYDLPLVVVLTAATALLVDLIFPSSRLWGALSIFLWASLLDVVPRRRRQLKITPSSKVFVESKRQVLFLPLEGGRWIGIRPHGLEWDKLLLATRDVFGEMAQVTTTERLTSREKRFLYLATVGLILYAVVFLVLYAAGRIHW